MSFIYAEKYRDENVGMESVRILCDTKIIPDQYTSMQFSEVQNDYVVKYGIVKSTIVNPRLCISYAGNNILFAAKLFSKLRDMGSFENDKVSAFALEVHNEAAALHSACDPNRYNDIEFLITYFHNDSFHIDRVWQGMNERNLPLAYIGSKDAFEVFQKSRSSHDGVIKKDTTQAFREVVDGIQDDTVGGRTIEVKYDYCADSFVFKWERVYYSDKPQIVMPGEYISLYLSPEDGGYSFEVVHKDIHNVLIIVDQMEADILYSKQYQSDEKDRCNPNLFGLMLPMLVKKKDGKYTRYR